MKIICTMILAFPAFLVNLLLVFVIPSSAICLPCQPWCRRLTPWDTYLSGNPDGLYTRGLFNPKITNPTNETIWVMGSFVVVSWDLHDMPDDVTNPKGTLLLGYTEPGSENEHLDLAHKLASNFDLKDGYVKIKCPRVEQGKDYIVVLFGDSGNRSVPFKIIK